MNADTHSVSASVAARMHTSALGAERVRADMPAFRARGRPGTHMRGSRPSTAAPLWDQ